MAPPEEAKTKRRQPASALALRSATVPSTLTIASPAGSRTDRERPPWAARCRIASGLKRATAAVVAGRWRSAASTSTFDGRDSPHAWRLSSTTRTVRSSATSRRTVCTPMKPAPPVTRMRLVTIPTLPSPRGGGNCEVQTLGTRRGAGRGDDRLAVLPVARGPSGRAGGNVEQRFPGAGPARRARGLWLHRGAGVPLPAAAGQWTTAPDADRPGGDAQQLGRQPDPAGAERGCGLRDAGAHAPQGPGGRRGGSGGAGPAARPGGPPAGGADPGSRRLWHHAGVVDGGPDFARLVGR